MCQTQWLIVYTIGNGESEALWKSDVTWQTTGGQEPQWPRRRGLAPWQWHPTLCTGRLPVSEIRHRNQKDPLAQGKETKTTVSWPRACGNRAQSCAHYTFHYSLLEKLTLLGRNKKAWNLPKPLKCALQVTLSSSLLWTMAALDRGPSLQQPPGPRSGSPLSICGLKHLGRSRCLGCRKLGGTSHLRTRKAEPTTKS